jgi:hypothetical protein
VHVAFLLAGVVPLDCSSNSSSGSQGPVGQSCATANQCYVGIDAAVLSGTVTCLTQVQGGYCTHTCSTDDDCCRVPGECTGGHPQLCAPFESTGQMYCFLSCESEILADAGLSDTNFCATYAAASFTCRSTGGGSQNRKICAP